MNYNSLMNKPTINYRELIGDNTVTEVGGITEDQFDQLLDTDLASYYTKAEIDELFARSFIYKEKSGSIVTFDCPASVNGIDKVISEIVAVQAGTGDPSPTNIRPITGWSSVGVTDCGQNLLELSDSFVGSKSLYHLGRGQTITSGSSGASINISGDTVSITNTTNWRGGAFFSKTLKANTSYRLRYRISGSNNTNVKRTVYLVDDTNKTVIELDYASAVQQDEDYVFYNTFTPSRDNLRLAFCVESSTAQTINIYDLGLNYPSTENSYTAYNGTTYTTQLKDGQGNPCEYFGCELVNTNGSQKVNKIHNCVDLGDYTWTKTTNAIDYVGFYTDITDKLGRSDLDLMCSSYVPTNKSSTLLNDGELGFFNTNTEVNYRRLMIRNDNFATYTEEQVKTALSGVQYYYTLATSEEIPQDNLAIATQEGTNNIWCNSGDITVKALDKIIQG